MSSSERTSMDIFMGIMDSGPLSLYSANRKIRMSIGTIHRHIKHLEKTGKIRVYESTIKGRKKIEYGPTLYGMISFYLKNKKFADLIQNYYLLWIEIKEFQRELENEGFEISSNLPSSKIVFQKYMEYFSAVEDQLEKIKKGESLISRDNLILISSGLLSANPYYQRLWEDLYQNLPGMRKTLDDYVENIVKNYKNFKNKCTIKK